MEFSNAGGNGSSAIAADQDHSSNDNNDDVNQFIGQPPPSIRSSVSDDLQQELGLLDVDHMSIGGGGGGGGGGESDEDGFGGCDTNSCYSGGGDSQNQHMDSSYEHHRYRSTNGGSGSNEFRGIGFLSGSRKLQIGIVAVVLIAFGSVLLPSQSSATSGNLENKQLSEGDKAAMEDVLSTIDGGDGSDGDSNAITTITAPNFKGAPSYQCTPRFIPSGSNSAAAAIVDETIVYPNANDDDATIVVIPPGHIHPKYTNSSAFLQELRTLTSLSEYDYHDDEYNDYGISYNDVQDRMYEFKTTYYVPYLKTGDSIYESGCGIGLNLLLTLDILQQSSIRDIHLYGTDYYDADNVAVLANTFLDEILTSEYTNVVGTGHRGLICPADTTHLAILIPNNSFDLVYTSRITPTLDPWLSHHSSNNDVNLIQLAQERRREICNVLSDATENDQQWKDEILASTAQSIQHDWFGSYVKQLLRIAKPGAPIIIEQISTPCSSSSGTNSSASSFDEWGDGVYREFWTSSTTWHNYGWNDIGIDTDSIRIIDDVIFPNSDRYNVFFLRKA